MALTMKLGAEEISTDESTGILTGDADPASTQDGTVTRLVKADEEIEADLQGLKTTADAHDHDPGGTPGGKPIGTNGRAISAGAIIAAKIGSGEVTNAKVATNAVSTAKINDGSATEAKLGDATKAGPFSVPGSGTYTWTHNLNRYILPHIECDDPAAEKLGTKGATVNAITLVNGGGSALGGVYVVHRGG